MGGSREVWGGSEREWTKVVGEYQACMGSNKHGRVMDGYGAVWGEERKLERERERERARGGMEFYSILFLLLLF